MEMYEGIASVKRLSVYLQELKTILNEQKLIAVICVKDTAGYWLDSGIQNELEELGIQENLVKALMSGYIAIVKSSVGILHEKLNHNDVEEYHGEIDGHRFDIISQPYNKGNVCSVKIDDQEYAIGRRGLNIVLFDAENNQVMDSVAFDTHVQNYACSRMKPHYDVGVVGCWWGANYGSCLNGYAVYRVLKDMGKSVLMISKPNATLNDWEVVNTHNARFVDRFYDPTEVSPCLSTKSHEELNDYCDTFISGSDQIWNYFVNKIFDMTFMLNFAHSEKKKLSFGTSFGKEVDITPKDKRAYSASLLKQYNAIAVREESGVRICNEIYGINATTVVEPVFCLPLSEYQKLAECSQLQLEQPYILTYILDPTPEKREAIQYYCEISGMKAYNVLDGDPRKYDKNKLLLDLPDIMDKIGADDFMKLYMNASLVITDSFHGSAFAIIFNKPLLSITNITRGAVRFNELLGKFKVLDRLCTNPAEIPHDPRFLEPIDYMETNRIIESERNRSIEWLRHVLETPVEELPPIEIPMKAIKENTVTTKLEKKFCTGCSACVNACPHDALSIRPDEYGYYRSVIDSEKCIDCGLCSRVCPVITTKENKNSAEPDCYALVAADEDIVMKSSSGGAFSLLANEVFRRGGIVAGAAWNEDNLTVGHILVDKPEELYKLRKSKYLQSYMGDSFTQVKEKLDDGQLVLFTGCACQIAGLKSFLRKDYDNLILVDIFCTYVPSAGFFKKYIESSFKDFGSYEFRHKEGEKCWDCYTVQITDKNGNVEVRRGPAEDDFQRVFHNHTMTDAHCEKCKFQNTKREGDITLGDFWDIGKKKTDIPSNKGVSCVLINNEKGRAFFESIPDEEIAFKESAPLSWLGGNGGVGNTKNYASSKRNDFFKAYRTMPFDKAVNYALKPNHGQYSSDYVIKGAPLHFKSNKKVFSFDDNVWEEHNIKGYTTLFVKPGQSAPGKFATIPLNRLLEKGQTYTLLIRFRARTDSEFINFHVKDSGSNQWQVMHYCKMSKHKGEGWIEITQSFVPNSHVYDEFMITASQIVGEDAYIAIDYISIQKL